MARSTSIREQRLALNQTTVGQLIEWQGRCVAGGMGKPSYSDLLDVLVAHVASGPVDVMRLVRAHEDMA